MIPDIGRISGRYIQKLADTVREIEASSGEATQLLVVSGGKKQCIIGDLTTRRGKYELVMDATYVAPLGGSVSNPFVDLAGEYENFADIKRTINQADIRQKTNLTLQGSRETGFAPAVPGLSFGRAGGSYEKVGRIICPLLEEDEEVPVTYID